MKNSWIKTELKRWILGKRRWKRKLVSRVSFVLAVVLRPRSHKRVAAVEFTSPRVSKAIGPKILSFLRAVASSLSLLSVMLRLCMKLRMCKSVTSQWVVSLAPMAPKLDNQVAFRLNEMIHSVLWWSVCLWLWKPWQQCHWALDVEQSDAQLSNIPSHGCQSHRPVIQVCGMQTFSSRRRATTIRTASWSKRRTQEVIGKASSQSPVWGDDAAKKLA